MATTDWATGSKSQLLSISVAVSATGTITGVSASYEVISPAGTVLTTKSLALPFTGAVGTALATVVTGLAAEVVTAEGV